MNVTRKLEYFCPVDVELESQDDIDGMYHIVAYYCEAHKSQFATTLKTKLSKYVGDLFPKPK